MVQALIGQTASTLLGVGLAMSGAYWYFTHPRRVVLETPEDLRPHALDVYRTAPDGATLHAIWIRAAGAGSDRTIIQHHGFNGAAGLLMADGDEPLTAWPFVRAARDWGYNLLLIDARAHGLSDGPWDSNGGQLVADLAGWVRWLRREHHQLWIGLWGNSLGSMLGLLLAVRPAAGGLDALVLDSTPVSADGLYSDLIGASAAVVVQPILRRLTDGARQRVFRDGRLVAKSCGWPPVLLVHGERDRHVPVHHSELALKLLREAGGDGNCDFWRIPGADHLQGLHVAGTEYPNRVLSWFDRWFSGEAQVAVEPAPPSRAWLAPVSLPESGRALD